MLRHPDAQKRVRQDEKRKLRNKALISRFKTLRRKVWEAQDEESREVALREAKSAIDKAAQKSAIHRNKASRLKSRLEKSPLGTTSKS